MKLTSTFVVIASVVTLVVASTASDVIADIKLITSGATALDNAVNAFPTTGGTLQGALTIHTDAQSLSTTIVKATTDAKNVSPKPFSASDASTVIKALQALEPVVTDVLKGVVVKKAALSALPIGGVVALVKQDLNLLSADTTALAAAVDAVMPADQVPAVTKIKNDVAAAFASAIAAYA
ncbi:hydrophobic surface binding protein A-domain-containing protein [Gymnopilus junonius]|uniref:Hydrophobic surface binding protein A-domain-containing protein n=1 Tax=Gymnopilus junonius TaxID=109634 RepID=A0A9P5TIP1_GYMJU|nr:hydrophobic surface binding protein A-domain-containing protein [Gymnopilus junonius]